MNQTRIPFDTQKPMWGDGRHLPLAAVLRQRRPSTWFSLSVLDQLAQKLDEAHDHGVTHGQLSVKTVGISREGEVHVAGLDLDPDATARFLWSDGTWQARPEPSHDGMVDPEPDIRAFVGIAHEMLEASQRGPTGPSAGAATPAPEAMHDVLFRARRSPGSYAHAQDLVRQLRDAMLDDIAISPEEQMRLDLLPAPRTLSWPAILLGLVMATLAAVAVIVGWTAFESRPQPPPEKVAAGVPSVAATGQEAPMPPGPPAEALASVAEPAATVEEPVSPPAGDVGGSESTAPAVDLVEPAPPTVAAPESAAVAPPAPAPAGEGAQASPASPGIEPPASPFVAGPVGIEFFPASDAAVGAAIHVVAPGSPAAQAGLQPKDIIVTWNGEAVFAPEDVKPGGAGVIRAEYLRELDGQLVRHAVEITEVPGNDGQARGFARDVQGERT